MEKLFIVLGEGLVSPSGQSLFRDGVAHDGRLGDGPSAHAGSRPSVSNSGFNTQLPTVNDGVALFKEAKIMYAPGKAANAAGVAISGLEMAQNAMHLTWTRAQVDEQLQEIMQKIHEKCMRYGEEKEYINYAKGANIGGFVKVADAMLGYGII